MSSFIIWLLNGHQHTSPIYVTKQFRQNILRKNVTNIEATFGDVSLRSKSFINLVCLILECSVCNKLFDLNSIETRCITKSVYEVNYDVISIKLIDDVIRMWSWWRHHTDVTLTSFYLRNKTFKKQTINHFWKYTSMN